MPPADTAVPGAPSTPRALVTGASTGIGAATVRRLRAEGWDVLATARRTDRLAALAAETGCATHPADLTSPDDVAALAEHVRGTGPLRALVNNAGGAIGADPVEAGRAEDWQRMYEINVLTTLRLTQALLPTLRADGGGDVVVVTSTAAHDTYPGGAGYAAAKHAERMIPATLRLELVGQPIRVVEIAPGMVRTEEFSLNRLHGDADAAANVYAGVAEPLVADDVADAIVWTLTRPAHVNIDSLVIRPRAQASNTLVAREG
ncbi:SDR family oxidoreductase [Georgenia sp. SYP-B2076]|uniref:SDR family oxidoreductase n=1 Tax=Georgenia sp. SYP-B2076 TaxID=2495881 RepID=UPI000F8D50A3|nr:SDR family oxidoreductase [Georgenia sp. SYP-B2076]